MATDFERRARGAFLRRFYKVKCLTAGYFVLERGGVLLIESTSLNYVYETAQQRRKSKSTTEPRL